MARLPSQLTYNDLNGEEIKEILLDWVKQLLDQQPVLQRHLTLPRVRLDVHIDLVQWAESASPESVPIHGSLTVNNDLSQYDSSREGYDSSREGLVASEPTRLSATVDASPSPGGHPPDQVREQHGLPVLRPAAGDRSIGSHITIADAPDRPIERARNVASTPLPPARSGDVAEGYAFSTEAVPGTGLGASGKPAGVVSIPAYGKSDAVRIDQTGAGQMFQGSMVVSATPHQGEHDLKGRTYGAVTGTLDSGPAGLAMGRPPRSKDDFTISRKG